MGGDEPSFELLGGVLRRVTDVIGPGAAYSMFHYAALQEGRRLASGAAGLREALERISGFLGVKAHILEEAEARVVVTIDPVVPPSFSDRGVQGLFLGLIEGALAADRQRPFKALSTNKFTVNGGPLRLEFGSET